MNFNNNRQFCFSGGGGSAPSVPPPPPPTPVPTPSDVAPQQTADQKQNKIKALQYGALSTIKTSPLGITGTGADLSKPSATGVKTTIGS